MKTKYKTDKTELEKKIPDVTDFVQKAKLAEFENKSPDLSSLATKTAFSKLQKLQLQLKIKYLMLVI